MIIPKPGLTVKINNYQLIENIGEGGCGQVFKAKQNSTGQMVAIKMLKFKDTLDDRKREYYAARFEKETQLYTEINHPNIVTLIDKGYSDKNEPFAAFEYISGETLKEFIVKENGLSAIETGDLMGQVLDALACAHAKGIVHRDLKPQNIMVTKTGSKSHIKLLDFGIGVFANDYQDQALTKEIIGTPMYSAPEQLRGEPSTVKSDLYSWGLIFLECIVGTPVMSGDSVAEAFQKQLHASDVPLPSAIEKHPIATLLLKVLDKNPNLRFAQTTLVYNEFSKINFNSITDNIELQSNKSYLNDDLTVANQMVWRQVNSEKRQITVLCVKLSLSMNEDSLLDMETLGTIQRDQLNICKDIAFRFGGHISGTLADNLMVYFGYPQVSDTDARRAGRTALELISQAQKRSALLFTKHGIQLDVRIGMHSGFEITAFNQTPEGQVSNIAFNLLYKANSGSILVSETTKKLLEPYLEFETFEKYNIPNQTHAIQTYLLNCERDSEAFSFIRTASANSEMVGRDLEREKMIELWGNVKNGNGQTAIIKGQSGIGKSKLIYVFKKKIHSEGGIVKECRCLPEYKNSALFPFFEMLKKDLGINDMTEPNIISKLEEALRKANCDLDIAMPVLCSWILIPYKSLNHALQFSPDKQKEVLFNTLEKYFIHIDDSEKLMLIVEDLHWMDPTSLDFLNKLIQSARKKNLFLLLSARPEFYPEWENDSLTVIQLNTLTKEFTKALIESVLGQKTIEKKALDYIAERTDGIPLFIEELTQMMLDQGHLVLKDKECQLVGTLDDKAVPVILQSLLGYRLDRLGFAKETAQIAAAIGRDFNYDLLVKTSLRDEAMVQADLNLLIKEGLVYCQRNVQSENYIFRHALIRDAAYDSMLTSARKQTHLRIADFIESYLSDSKQANNSAQLEILAEHLYCGKRILDGVRRLLQASEITKLQSANRETRSLCYKALLWIQQVQSTIQVEKLELSIRQVLIFATMAIDGYGSQEVGEQLKIVSLLSKGLNDTGQFFPTVCTQVNYYMMRGDWKSATNAAQLFHQEAQKQVNSKWVIASSVILGQQYFTDGRFMEAAQLLEQALDLYRHDNHKQYISEFGIEQGVLAAGILCTVYHFLGRSNEIPELELKARKWAENLDHIHTNATLSFTLSCLYFYKGDKEKVKYFCTELAGIGTKEEPNMFMALGKFLEYWAFNKLESIKLAVMEQETSGIIAMRSFWHTIIAELELEAGNFLAAKKRVQKALSWIDSLEGNLLAAELHRLLGLSFLGLHEKKLARKQFAKAKNIAVKQGAKSIEMKVEAVMNMAVAN